MAIFYIILLFVIFIVPGVLGLNVLRIFLQNGTSRLVSVVAGNAVTFFFFMIPAVFFMKDFFYQENNSLSKNLLFEVPVIFLLITFFIYTLFYRRDPGVRTTFKEIVTVGDITSDKLFLQSILFMFLYGISMVATIFPIILLLDVPR